MGKLFAVVVTVITLISVAFFVMYTWWPLVDISTTGLAIDHQLDRTFVETGILFLAVSHPILLTLHSKDVGHSFYVPVEMLSCFLRG